MARHTTRAELVSSGNTHLQFVSMHEARSLVEEGYAVHINGSTFKLTHRHVTAAESTLTSSDMERNGEAVADQKRNRLRLKVDAWPSVCDTFAVTIVNGRVFIPDAREAAKRVKQMRKKAKTCGR